MHRERESTEMLQRVRDAIDGPLVIIKGAEVAAYYPRPGLRLWSDLDLVVPDSARALRQLCAAGFVADGGAMRDGHHHEVGLSRPGSGLKVELHHALPLPEWGRQPGVAWLLDHAEPSRTGIDGLLAPRPSVHAVIVAAHAWRHCPFRSVLDLLDEELLLVGDGNRDAASAVAAELGLRRLWNAEREVGDAIFHGGPPVRRLARPFARDLTSCSERSATKVVAAVAAGPLFADAPAAALRALAIGAARLVRPHNIGMLSPRRLANRRR